MVESSLRQLFAINLALWVTMAGLALPVLTLFNGWSSLHSLFLALVCLCGAASTWAWTLLAVRTRYWSLRARWVWLSLVLVAGTLLVCALATYLKIVPVPRIVTIDGMGREMPLQVQFLRNWSLIGPTHFLYAAIAAALTARDALQARERSLVEARLEAQTAQLAALRAQVDPHFLFNTLNTATALIETDRSPDARALLLRLGEYFRGSLETNPSPFSSLQDEFDAVDAYLQIELARFGERLRLEMSLPDALRTACVPTAILQPLAENAVRHGAAQAHGAVTITLRACTNGRELSVIVEDDAAASSGQAAAHSGNGIGLANVSARLAAHYGTRASLTSGHEGALFRATLELPLAHMEADCAS